MKVTSLVATVDDPNEGTAYDPSLAPRMRVRDAGSGVKVVERDARIAFVSTGDLEKDSNPDHLPQLFLWREQDGPRVRAPARRGFGTRLLSGLADQLGGEAALDYPADGFRYRFSMPLGAPGAD